MRYVIAAILVCAVGAPSASALPRVSADAIVMSKADPFVQVAKHKRAPSRRQARDSGIHPLVGSGGY